MESSPQNSGKSYELFHSKTFRAEIKERIGREYRRLFIGPTLPLSLGFDERFERIAKCLPSLPERSLYHSLEQRIRYSQILS